LSNRRPGNGSWKSILGNFPLAGSVKDAKLVSEISGKSKDHCLVIFLESKKSLNSDLLKVRKKGCSKAEQPFLNRFKKSLNA